MGSSARRFRAACAGAVVALVMLPQTAAAADAPRWLLEAARRPATAIERDADAVVLHDEEQVTVQAAGRIVRRRMYAVRVKTKVGARAATMREVYRADSGEVRSLKAWIVSGSKDQQLGKEDTTDAALVNNDVYNEARVRTIAALSQVVPGDVFGAESEKVEATVFSQIEWWLQGQWPVLELRRTLTLPSGWDAQSMTFNRPSLTPAVQGNSRTWTVREVIASPEEPSGPPTSSLVQRLGVTYYGTPRSDTAFASWDSVGRWLATLQDPPSRPTAAVTAKARELTASVTNDLARIRLIGSYAQKVQYISIQTGVGRGGGYTPHAAADVLEKNYGDCKDKANLMRALLASVNLPSVLVAIYAGDPTYVREQWPSPQQFNHAIIGIPVPRGTRLPAVVEDESGAMLFFDPTDPYTPLGHLPLTLQDSHALVVSPTAPRLRRMPAASQVQSRRRTVVANLLQDGQLTASIESRVSGHLAVGERRGHTSVTKEAYANRVAAEVRSRVTGATVTINEVKDDEENNQFALTARMQARPFAGGASQGGLMFMLTPLPLADAVPTLRPGPRQTAVVFEAREEEDRFEITLADGVVVDELPAPQMLEMPFGRFEARWTSDGSRLTRVLSLRIERTVLPPADYSAARTFVDRFRDAERQPVVLRRR